MAKDLKTRIGALVSGVFALLVVMLLVVLFVVYTGSYNIAATEDHAPFTRWVLETTMKNSIQRQAADIEAPELTHDMVEAGAREYKAMCQHCHGGPGVEPDKWSRGMLPQPPHLHETIGEWEKNEVYWLVKHGAKMTGMPAFGPSHDDEALWSIVAFATRLPGLTDKEYAQFDSRHDHSNGH